MAKRLMVRVGEYEGKDENGNPKTKGEYVKVGVILSSENGEFALLDPSVSLAGCLMKQRVMNRGKEQKGKGDMVMASIFSDESQQQAQSQRPASSGEAEGFDDDIPF